MGKELHETLSSLDSRIGAGAWVYQPNARFGNPAYYEEKRRRLQRLEEAAQQHRRVA